MMEPDINDINVMLESNRGFAVAFTMLAAVSAGLGGVLVAFFGEASKRKVGHMLSFSVGVMLYLSFVDLFSDAVEHLGAITANIALFIGMITFALLESVMPAVGLEDLADEWVQPAAKEKADDDLSPKSRGEKDKTKRRISRTAVLTCVGMSLHNIPEGIAVYLTCLKGAKAGLPLAMAMMLHNIPEGMAVACPVYAATRSKWCAIKWSLGSGLFELVGMVVFECFLSSVLTNFIMHCTLAAVAGVMLVLCFTELIPETLEAIEPREAVLSNIAGMFIMFSSRTFTSYIVQP